MVPLETDDEGCAGAPAVVVAGWFFAGLVPAVVVELEQAQTLASANARMPIARNRSVAFMVTSSFA
jgi:hypothetical protein